MEINNIPQNQNPEHILKDYQSIKKFLYNISNDPYNFSVFEKRNTNNKSLNQSDKFNSNIILNNKLNNLMKENLRLKFCLNNIKEIFDKEIKTKINNINKQNQQINEEQKNLNENNLLIEDLNQKIGIYEKIADEMNRNQNEKINYKNNNDNYEFTLLKEENKKLKEEINSKDKLIENIKNEIKEKKGLFSEINKIKKEMNNIIQTMENLNNEIEEKDKIIKELKDNEIPKSRNKIQNKEKEILLKQIKENREKKLEINKEYENIKLKLMELKNKKEKLKELSQTSNQILKTALETKEKIKNEYENYIQNIIEEYEQKIKEENEKKEFNILAQEDKLIIEENEKIKKENEDLMNKIKDFPNLEKKYNELFKSFAVIQEENINLKKNLNNDSFSNKNINNRLSDGEIINPNENTFRKENKIPQIKNKEIIYNTDIRREKMSKTLNNNHMSEELSGIVYYKKKPQQKSVNSSREYPKNMKISYNNCKNSKEFNINDMEVNNEVQINSLNTDNIKSENLINESFNLYKPIKEGLLSFNLSKKNYNLVIPENYDNFWNNFEPENSIQYNTLEGLFIINSKDNQLYYYSSKKNSFCELFYFNFDHKEGCLFLDNLSKNIIAIGGINTTSVEKFSFETGAMEELPELSTHRYKMSCCQVGNKIYCFFGISVERKNESLIEYLDLDNISEGWVEIIYQNKTSFNLLTYMSCVNLNDFELLIIGGLIEDNVPNQKLLYYNVQKNEFIELNKDLPDSDVKRYLFSKNIMFNLFLKDDVISFTNIDDNNQVHILDNDLKYDLYLAPKL